MDESKSVVVHANVHDPSYSIFSKPKKSDRAQCQTILCSNDDCQLLKRGQCTIRSGLFGGSCPYGRKIVEYGPTMRAGSFYSWLREHREKYKDVPFLQPPTKMAFVGEYVALPYSHMGMCESLPFLGRSRGIGAGCAFLPTSDWTVDNVQKLIQFRPQAIFGGEIPSYQKEEIPKFLVHLRETDPAMWSQLVVKMPHLDVAPNHVGRKAVLSTLNAPLEWWESTKDHGGEYAVNWKWDGKKLFTTSKSMVSETWGRIKLESALIEAIPKERATVVVQSNDWVNTNTEFET